MKKATGIIVEIKETDKSGKEVVYYCVQTSDKIGDGAKLIKIGDKLSDKLKVGKEVTIEYDNAKKPTKVTFL